MRQLRAHSGLFRTKNALPPGGEVTEWCEISEAGHCFGAWCAEHLLSTRGAAGEVIGAADGAPRGVTAPVVFRRRCRLARSIDDLAHFDTVQPFDVARTGTDILCRDQRDSSFVVGQRQAVSFVENDDAVPEW